MGTFDYASARRNRMQSSKSRTAALALRRNIARASSSDSIEWTNRALAQLGEQGLACRSRNGPSRRMAEQSKFNVNLGPDQSFGFLYRSMRRSFLCAENLSLTSS